MAKNQQKTEESKALNFEQTITKLNDIVDAMEQGQIPLQDSLKQYEKGMSLIKLCREILQKAEKKIEESSLVSRVSESESIHLSFPFSS